jgi:glycyl-tRNA synthetase
MREPSLEDIVSLAKRRGFVYPGSEIYGGIAGVYDYGPLGAVLKRNIQNFWLKMFVEGWDDMYLMDSGILMNSRVWQASGHATGFNDPMVECLNCHSRLRADHIENNKCPVCGKVDMLSNSRQFNMMFKTQIGPLEDENSITYLRPETAQGLFVNFKNIIDSFYPDLPFGLAQIGKAFRNEISPRDFLFRLREMEQMEIEYFVAPEQWQEKFEHWRKDMHNFLHAIGIPEDTIVDVEVPQTDRAHYSARTIDIEFKYPFGQKELMGLAYRTDYDLKKHQEASGKSMEYTPKGGGPSFIPHVIEPSMGMDRVILAVLVSTYTQDLIGEEKRLYLKLPAEIAPYKLAVFPLLKNKPQLVEKATQVYDLLKKDIKEIMWDDNGNIGKRYRRQDEIGTPKTITIDFQTLDDDTVTVRDRDTTEQKRSSIENILRRD